MLAGNASETNRLLRPASVHGHRRWVSGLRPRTSARRSCSTRRAARYVGGPVITAGPDQPDPRPYHRIRRTLSPLRLNTSEHEPTPFMIGFACHGGVSRSSSPRTTRLSAVIPVSRSSNWLAPALAACFGNLPPARGHLGRHRYREACWGPPGGYDRVIRGSTRRAGGRSNPTRRGDDVWVGCRISPIPWRRPAGREGYRSCRGCGWRLSYPPC